MWQLLDADGSLSDPDDDERRTLYFDKSVNFGRRKPSPLWVVLLDRNKFAVYLHSRRPGDLCASTTLGNTGNDSMKWDGLERTDEEQGELTFPTY